MEEDQDPYENPVTDRDLEAEGDDGGEQHHAEILLYDLPEDKQAEVLEQLEQIKREDTEAHGKDEES